MQRYRRTFICILPHDGRIPKKDKKINAFIIYVHAIKSKTLNVLNFIKDIARLSYYEKRSNYNSSYTKN